MKSRSILIICVHIFASALVAHSQNNSKSETAIANYNIADSLLKAGNYKESQKFAAISAEGFKSEYRWENLVDALNLLSENKWRLGRLDEADSVAAYARTLSQTYLGTDHILEASALNNLGNIKILRGMLAQSLIDHNEGLRIKKKRLDEFDPELAGAYSNIGVIYDYLGDYDKALSYYERALIIDEKVSGGKHADLAMSYNNIANIYEFKGDIQRALAHYERALDIDLDVLGSNHPDVAAIYSNIGTVHYLNGSFDLANDNYSKALIIRESNFGSDHPSLADSYNNMGTMLYEKKNYPGAIEMYLKSYHIRRSVSGKDNTKSLNVLQNLAKTHMKMDETEKAQEYFSRALAISKDQLPMDHPDIAKSYGYLGRYYVDLKQSDKAIENFKKALDIYQVIFVESHPEFIRTLNGLAQAYILSGQYDSARQCINKAISGSKYGMESSSVLSLGYGQRYLLSTFRLSAQIYKEEYVIDRDDKKLVNALEDYAKCDQLIDELRKENLRHADKLYVGSIASDIYPAAVVTCDLLYKSLGDPLYLDRAFYFSEKNRGVALAQNLSDQSAKSFGGIPADFLEFERRLSVDRSFYQTELLKLDKKGGKSDSTKLASYQDKLFTVKQQSDSLKKALEKDYPDYYELKYANTILETGAIQESLESDQVLLEYIESDSTIFVFVITNDSYWITSISRTVELDTALAQYLNSLRINALNSDQNFVFNEYSSSASTLYRFLLQPIIEKLPEKITHLAIVPDGQLAHVPWDIFLTEPANADDFKSLKYLLNNYSISYGHSASLLYGEQTVKQKSTKPFLAFAPVYENMNYSDKPDDFVALRDELIPLKWNQSEVESIGQYFAGGHFKGSNATEARFKNEAGDYQILHLAMHAFVDNENPMLSKFVFSQAEDSIEDGLLHAYELFDMNLSAEMAVLSACKTGLGKIEKGEGVMSLGNAFSYAGCRSVVISHWSVDDKSTSQLMNTFYEYISEGFSKDVALQQAKLKFLKDNHGRTTHPLYWAGFVVMGNTDPISGQGNWFWFGIIALVLTVAGYVTYNSRR